MRIDVFCHQKNNKKADSLYMKLSLTKSASVQSVCIPYFKINPLIYCCPRLFEEYLNPQVRINKMVNDHSVNYHPNLSGLISPIDPPKFLWIHYRFISLQNICWVFLKPVYPTFAGENFQIYGVQITGKCIFESKNWIHSLLMMPP